MALYRTYRPATFADVVGQEHVTDPLSRALDGGRINHAYLFSGPRGCGKTSSARILARSLNCVQGPTSTPCGECSSCVALAPGGPGNLDVIELDAASHGGVDDTRELRDRAFYAPSESRYRVFIVDEAHMVTTAGFNALLKIVEEPPEHLIFVFATTEPEKVLPTIRSRTHHYPFRLLAPPVMRGLLEKICAQEQVTVAPDVYPLVIRAGGGSPRDSLSILDQLLAGADDSGVTYDRALALLGVTDIALIDEAIDGLAAADGARLFGTVEKVVDAGHDPRRFAVDLLERLRDLILLQAVPDAAERGLVEAPGDQLERMRGQIERLGPAGLTRFAEVVHAALGEMRGTTSPRLLLEVMCARMLLPGASTSDPALLQRLERLESGVVIGGSAAPASGSAPDPTSPAAPVPGVTAPAAADEPPPKYVRPSQRKAAEVAQTDADDQASAEPAAPVERPTQMPPRGNGTPTAPQPPARAAAEREQAPEEAAPAAQSDVVTAPSSESTLPEPEAPRTEAPKTETPQAEPEPTPEPERPQQDSTVSTAADDDIPLPDEPMDEYSTPEPESPAPASRAEEPVASPSAAGGLDAETVRKRFQEVRSAVRERSKSLEPMLSAAVVHDLDDQTVILTHPAEVLVGRLSAPHAIEILRDALRAVFESELDVRTVHSASAPAPTAAAAAPAAASQQRRPTYSRPSRANGQGGDRQVDTGDTGSGGADLPPEPEEPEPQEPRSDDEISDAERDEMVAEAQSGRSEGRLDPETVAMDLLKNELGARPLE